MLQTSRTRSRTHPEMNSARTRYGQVWTLSGRSEAAMARARPDWTLTSSWSWMGAPTLRFSAILCCLLERTGDAAVLTNAPEVQDHEDGGDDGDEDAVQDVEAEQGRRAHHRPGGEEGARIVARGHAELRPERTFVFEQRRRARHVGANRHCPDGELIPGKQIPGEREQERQREQVHADHPVELARRLV